MDPAPELPDHFEDSDVCKVLRKEDTSTLRQYVLNCGLVIKLRTALLRVLKRSVLKLSERKALGSEDECLYSLVDAFTIEKEFLHKYWPCSKLLHRVVLELSIKAINLSSTLQRELSVHPLGVPVYKSIKDCTSAPDSVELNGINYPVESTGEAPFIQLNRDFLIRVREYHDTTRRPAGTFDSPVKTTPQCSDEAAAGTVAAVTEQEERMSSLITALVQLPKEVCPACLGRRQVYCGDCKGLRMSSAYELLPARVELPFDVLLLLHWQETLHKCTGVHVGALCTEGTFDTAAWTKEIVPACSKVSHSSTVVDGGQSAFTRAPPALREQWKNAVEALDADRDVLLFPCEDAVLAEDFDWSSCPYQPPSPVEGSSSSGASAGSSNRKWRLVVLEASWNYGKGMAAQIRTHRASVGLPLLHCVQLRDITGQYWKFQTEGHSAVSTIEAITHTAKAAGSSQETVDTMLTLFQLQKLRVLRRIEEGGKVPRALEVSGAGLGCWRALTDCLDEL